MDVAITELRAGLAGWIDRAREGEEVIVTERGRPVAKIVAVERESRMDQLVREGKVTLPTKPKRRLDAPTVRTEGSLSDLVTELRRSRDDAISGD